MRCSSWAIWECAAQGGTNLILRASYLLDPTAVRQYNAVHCLLPYLEIGRFCD
ncbi:MAG: hypothetical protein JW759_04540 [Candidatus Coatesbacteria bacterium]|nr:hypothetical protein [Candidatus Coatesbacteria bacterium]